MCAIASAPDRPLVLVGYSNGGALITKYALDALEDASLPPPSKLILVSAMIGVSPAARLASTISLLGPVVPKARWIDVVPEYNPFKYNSFPANAGAQTARLTGALNTPAAAGGTRGPVVEDAAGAGLSVDRRHDGELAGRGR